VKRPRKLIFSSSRKAAVRVLVAIAALQLTGCVVGPKYHQPAVQAPPAYKEVGDWKPAQPNDQNLGGNWWTVFQDPQLDALELQVNVSNQNLKAAEAQFQQARAALRYNRADYYPTVTAGPSATRTRVSANAPTSSLLRGATYNDFVFPFDVSYQADVWGRVRKTVESYREQAQASAADLATVNLSMHADLAVDYFQARSLDAEEQLLNSTVKQYEQALELTESRFQGGIASEVEVEQAKTILQTTRAEAIDVGVARAQYEHAVATRRGIAYLQNSRFIPVHGFPGGEFYLIAGDSAGNLWISDQDHGLFHLLRGSVVEKIPSARLGHKGNANALVADPVQGGLWLGFYQGGVAYFKEGEVRKSYAAADGLAEGRVSALQLDQDRTLWAATEGGLSRLKSGRFATLTSKNGLPCNTVHWMIEDDEHSVWLYMACGLVRIARPELDAWLTDPKRTIQTTVFDSSDGVRSHSALGGFIPHVAKSIDGKLWFLPLDGVSVIDPRHLPFNKLPPPVHIEQVTADRKTYGQNLSSDALSSHPRLPPLVRDLTIDYTALSLVVPEKVHFRFKLEGQDRDWREVVNNRQVQYSNLRPGHYRFRVTACNNSGVWNEAGTFLDFSIAPAYYQTTWFRALCAVAFLALLWALYQVRVQQVRRQEKKLRDVIETMPTFAWSALPDGSVDFVNRHWQEYTGLSAERTVGSGWQAAVHTADLKRHAEKWSASLATGDLFENEVRYRRAADGQYHWFLTRAVPLRDQRGKILKWYGISTDIEDRKRAEEERERLRADLAHVNRVSMLGELAASVSHELKQPITAAMTNAKTCLRWLKREQPDVDEAIEATSRIVKDGSRATEIIERLRSLYKKDLPQRELVGVNEIIREMVELLRAEANQYAVSIRTDLVADLPKITADRVQLQQVFMNLVLNAIEAMKEIGGVLTVKTQLGEDGQLLISVSDTGVGLPKEKTEQIFDAFFTTKPKGSGIGLSISRSIVESHGGRLWATANNGRGATFHFTLPTAAETLQVPATGT